jgi:hypothetical protein
VASLITIGAALCFHLEAKLLMMSCHPYGYMVEVVSPFAGQF